jgi:hypothetical protein
MHHFSGQNKAIVRFIGIMSLTEVCGRDAALRRPRRRAQRQATESRTIYHVPSVLPDGDTAARRPGHIKLPSTA